MNALFLFIFYKFVCRHFIVCWPPRNRRKNSLLCALETLYKASIAEIMEHIILEYI